MASPVIFFLILFLFAAAADVQRIYPSENPLPVGSTVTLFSQDPVATGAWMFSNDIIVMIFSGGQIITDSWRDRVTFNTTTSSLTIRSLQTKDSGLYTLQEINSFRAQLTLSVQVPVSNVTLRANTTHLVEFNDTAVLTCSVLNGSSLSYAWLKGSTELTAGGGVQLSDGGATLTMVSVTRSDKGTYRCNVSNGVSDEVSEPVYLNVSYGPTNTMMTIMPMKSTYVTGSNITLWCSAESSPPAVIRWMFEGVYLNSFGPLLQLENVTVSNSGSYRCLLHNNVTSRFSSESATIRIVDLVIEPLTTNMSGVYTCKAYNNITDKSNTAFTMLTVLAPVTMASIKIDGPQPIQNHMFSLTCETAGSVESIIWLYDWNQLYADNTTNFSMNNSTLTFDPVMISDNGDYQCVASNPLSSFTSQFFTLDIFYGPQMPAIMGPSVAQTGNNVTFSCYASSNPPSSYEWFFNGSLVANTSEYITPLLTEDMSGMYTCMAYNNITGKNSTAYTMLTVFAPITMASIKIDGPQPIQNHTFSLTCETAGSVESIIWFYDWNQLYADNTRNFSMNNSTLTFDAVMTSDNGNYQCVASNPLSIFYSQFFTLDVFYGPQMPAIMGPHAAKTGNNVTFSCYASSNPPSSYEWFFNGSLVANTSEYITPLLTEDMSGMYTCMAYNNITGKNSTAYTMLTVFDRIHFVKIETLTTPAIEGQFYQLMCNVTGPVEHVYWMKNGEPLHEGYGTALTMDNQTVTFNPLRRNDTGYYQCLAINAVWNMTSAPYKLLVNFGPQTPVIDGPDFAEVGQNAVFHCSALSVPPSQFSWTFNGFSISNSSVYTTGILSLSMSGEYTCMAYNNVTGNTNSASKNLTVINATESVIRADTIPINSENFTLICDVTGPFDMIYWMKDGVRLNMTNSTAHPDMSYDSENSTLLFTPLTVYDDGIYQCVAISRAGPHESPPYMLLVNYGPLTVNILGPETVGNTVKFTCSADSRPDCDFLWFFNNNLSSVVKTGPVYTFPASKKSEGNYTCEARNPVTNITKYRTEVFTLSAHASTFQLPSHGGLMMLGLFALFVPVLFS